MSGSLNIKTGLVELLSCFRYRCQEGISLPFKVLSVINDLGRTRMELNVQAKSTFSSKLFAQNMVGVRMHEGMNMRHVQA